MFNELPVFSVEVDLSNDQKGAGGLARRRNVKSKLFNYR